LQLAIAHLEQSVDWIRQGHRCLIKQLSRWRKFSMLKQILVGSSLCAGLWLAALPVQAQSSTQTPAQPAAPEASPAATEVSQAEVQQFAETIKAVQAIQVQAQEQASQILEGQNLTQERFREILQSEQDPQAQPTPAVTDTEKEQFERVNEQLSTLQQTTRQQIDQAIQTSSLPRDRFVQILSMVQQDPSLRERIQQQLQN
jgi:Domain of unknown function (DUF4168)